MKEENEDLKRLIKNTKNLEEKKTIMKKKRRWWKNNKIRKWKNLIEKENIRLKEKLLEWKSKIKTIELKEKENKKWEWRIINDKEKQIEKKFKYKY